MPRNPDLEREILTANHDPQAYAVYADWLQAQGDPRGELMLLSGRDADEFLDAHREHFLGRFANQTPETFELTWRAGFIQKATIGWELFAEEFEDDESDVQLEQFLRLESAGLIEELVLGPTPDTGELSLEKLAHAIGNVGLPSLRRLDLDEIDSWDISQTSTGMPDCAAVPALRSLSLKGGTIYLPDAIDLPELTSFTVVTGGLTKANLATISAARWPKLERLEIWFGEPAYGANCDADDCAAILAATGLPNVRSLGLENCAFADALVERLIDSAILPQLTRLDLGSGNLSDRGLGLMLAAKRRFAHLEHLDLDNSALTNQHWPAARELAKQVVFGNLHSPERAVPRTEETERERYVSLGE